MTVLGYGRPFENRYAGVRYLIHEGSFGHERTSVRNGSSCGRLVCRDAPTRMIALGHGRAGRGLATRRSAGLFTGT